MATQHRRYSLEAVDALQDELTEARSREGRASSDVKFLSNRLAQANDVIDKARTFIRAFNKTNDWDRQYDELCDELDIYDNQK